MSHNLALLLASPGDVSESLKAGIQIVAKVRSNEEDQRKSARSLAGVLLDIRHMQNLLDKKCVEMYDAFYRHRFTKQEALQAISTFFARDPPSQVYMVYYSGHGERLTGNWVFTDGTISYDEIISMWCQSGKSENYGLWIISDSCFSGQWIQTAHHLNTSNCMFIRMLCSSEANKVSYDTSEGGDFTIKFTQGNHERLATPAVSCEIVSGRMQKSIMHSTIGNYVKQNWLQPTQVNSSNYAEPYRAQADLENDLYTSHPGLYSIRDMRQERVQQAYHLRRERAQQTYQQQHERSLEVYQNRNARMLEVQQNRNQRVQEAQQRSKHQYSSNHVQTKYH
ncbi:unnamed protein product [Rotaria socialis]|uniref:Peptidase C14 caspase domain-containing protein n=1 Tax=Rotaria socialis TaxID=392032 RepID=A0A821UEY1_9BILA|nr:unnamed protein product [Rotaria socialis]CAF4888797.1 unnamed protein product [Rotaria socialis]